MHVKHSFSETWGSEDSYHDKSDVYEYLFCVRNMNTKTWKNAGDNVLNQIYQKNKVTQTLCRCKNADARGSKED